MQFKKGERNALCFASSFTPALSTSRAQGFKCCKRPILAPYTWKAVASKKNRTSEEFQRLKQKLEELRAKREEVLSRQKEKNPPSDFSAPASYPDVPSAPIASEELEIGKHGEDSRFLSFSTVGGGEFFPRIVPLLDNFPTLRPTDVTGCPSLSVAGKPEMGQLSFARIPPGFNAQVFALPLTGALADLVDPIAIAVSPDVISSNLPVDGDRNVVLVVERNLEDLDWDNYKFYVWGVGDRLRIGWVSDLPPSDQAECLGRVVCVFLEEPAGRRKARSCWQEESETYYG